MTVEIGQIMKMLILKKSNKDKNVGGDKGDKNKVKSMNGNMINWIYCDDCGDRIDYENAGFKEEFADYEAKSVMRDVSVKSRLISSAQSPQS